MMIVPTDRFGPTSCAGAFMRTAQYIAAMLPGAKVLEEASQIVRTAFVADTVAFLPHGFVGDFTGIGNVAEDVQAIILGMVGQVRDGGFMTTETTLVPRPAVWIALPVTVSGREAAVMLVGYDGEDKPPRHLLDAMLGVAALVSSALERQLTDLELRESANNRRLILDAVGDGICSVDANGVITFANKAALDILGCIEQQLIGVPAVEIVVEGETLAAGSGYDQVRREVILRRRDGTTFPAELVCVPIVSKGHSAGVVATFADISERKAKEAQLSRLTCDLQARVQEEIKARQRQDLLMAELDHRVKNMLATIHSILGLSRVSEDTLDGFLKTFEGRLRAMSLAHSLLTKGRWEGANLRALLAEEMAPYVGGPLPAVEIVAEGQVMLRPKAALAFSLAVHELATNAAKYGALSVPGGHVRIDWCSERRDGLVMVFHWVETGGPATAKPPQRGFGLTLIESSLAYEVGGTVELGFPDEGLTCTVTVPWDQLASPAEPHLPAPVQPNAHTKLGMLKGARILVVEDNALLAAVTVRSLEIAGASVVGPASRLEAAVEMAKTAEIDVAVLDVDLDGTMVWPAADQLRSRGIPFVFATGYQASLVMPQRFEEQPVLYKPFTPRELQGVLGHALAAPRSRHDQSTVLWPRA